MPLWHYSLTHSLDDDGVYNEDGGNYVDLLHSVQVLKNHLRLIPESMILDHMRTQFLGGDLICRATYTRVYTVLWLHWRPVVRVSAVRQWTLWCELASSLLWWRQSRCVDQCKQYDCHIQQKMQYVLPTAACHVSVISSEALPVSDIPLSHPLYCFPALIDNRESSLRYSETKRSWHDESRLMCPGENQHRRKGSVIDWHSRSNHYHHHCHH